MKQENEDEDYLIKELEEYLDTYYVNQVSIECFGSGLSKLLSLSNRTSKESLKTNPAIGVRVNQVISINFRKSII